MIPTFRPRPQIDPDEYLRSHPVLTQADLATASQVGQLPGTEDEIPAFTLDEAESMLPGTAPDAPTAPRLAGWDDVRGGMSRAVSGLTSGLRGLGDMARQAAPIDPWQGAPALPGTAPDAPEQVQATAPQALTPPAAPSAPASPASAPTAAPAGDRMFSWDDVSATPARPPAMGLPGTAPDQPGQYQPLPNPFQQTDADRKALEDAEKRDNRLRIASGIMRGLGFLTQFGAGLAGNNPLGNAAGAASVNFNPQIDGAEQVRRRIAERQANDYRAMQFEQGQRDRFEQSRAARLQAERQAREDDLNTRYRQAQIGRLDQESRMSQDERDTAQANADVTRQILRATVESMPASNPLAAAWARVMADPNGAFENADVETLQEIDNSIGGIMRTKAYQNARGVFSGSRQLVDGPNGPRWVTSGGGRVQTVGDALAAERAAAEQAAAGGTAVTPQPVADRPAGRVRGAGVHRGARPAAAPAPAGAPPAPGATAPAPGAPAAGSGQVISADDYPGLLRQTYSEVYGPDFETANAAARTAYRLDLARLTGSRDQQRAVLDSAAHRLESVAVRQNSVVPPEHQAEYRRIAREMDAAERQYVVPYAGIQQTLINMRRRIAAMPDPAERARATAQLFAAMQGNAAAANALGVRGLHSRILLGRETFGRGQSGAAIGGSEWANFDSILGRASVLDDVSDMIDALENLLDKGDAHMDSIAGSGSIPQDTVLQYWDAIHAPRPASQPARTGSGDR